MKHIEWKAPLLLWVVFEGIAATLWLVLHNPFYLMNFSYIGTGLALGVLLYLNRRPAARNVTQWIIGMYMLVYLGLMRGENMQLEGFWYYLFQGLFEAAVIHYLIAKIAGPLIFGRGWCGYACWTAMVLDLLPYKTRCKPASYFSRLRVTCDNTACISCGKCRSVCPMDVDMTDNARSRPHGTECILCLRCVEACPQKALKC